MDAKIVILVVSVLLLIVICVALTEKRINPLPSFQDVVLPKFSVPFEFQLKPAKKDFNNSYDCNTKTLRKCILGDVTSLLGCKEMTVTCNRFESDISFHENGEVSVIPKNEHPDEGYALSIRAIADACNPFHGDMVLISGGIESRDYVLGCLCKNPGYIGSEHVLDSCTTPHICNGQIDDINQPLDSINCVCGDTETPSRYDDGLPVCKEMTVNEANKKYKDWSHLVPWSSDRLIDKNVFNATIRSNFNSKVLLNPCESSLTDMGIAIQGARYDRHLKTCAFTDFGLPVRTGTLDPNENTTVCTTVDAALPSGRHRYMRVIDNIGGVRKTVNVRTAIDLDLVTGGPSGKTLETNVTLPSPLGVGKNAQFSITTADQILGGRCTGSWPYYDCRVEEYFSHREMGIPMSGNREAPGMFLWKTETWEKAERMMSSGMRVKRHGLELDNEYLDVTKDTLRYYGIKLCHEAQVDCFNGMVGFNNIRDYEKHQSILY